MLINAFGQICRVEDVHINGTVLGSAVHVQRVKTISIRGLFSSSSLGVSLYALKQPHAVPQRSRSDTLLSFSTEFVTFNCKFNMYVEATVRASRSWILI